MYAAMSTACLYPLETEDSLEYMLKSGIKNFEIFINSDSELENSFIQNLRVNLDAYGASVYSVHLHTSAFEPLMFFSAYKRRFKDSVSQYKQHFQSIKKLGASVVVFHGDRKEGSLPETEYFDRFARLSLEARQEGLILAQENVARCRSRDVIFVENMRKYLGFGNVKFVLDLKQALRANISPYDMLSAMGNDIINVHISDSDELHDCLLPGSGNVDFPGFFHQLTRFGYQGPAVIEVYRSNFINNEELLNSYNYVSFILS